jgi:ethanolamine utilization protein EutN
MLFAKQSFGTLRSPAELGNENEIDQQDLKMQLAKVVGRATATVKHKTLAGWRLLLIQPLDAAGKADGDPQLAIDSLGSRKKDIVMVTTDGAAVREIIGANDTPVRWAVIGIADQQ